MCMKYLRKKNRMKELYEWKIHNFKLLLYWTVEVEKFSPIFFFFFERMNALKNINFLFETQYFLKRTPKKVNKIVMSWWFYLLLCLSVNYIIDETIYRWRKKLFLKFRKIFFELDLECSLKNPSLKKKNKNKEEMNMKWAEIPPCKAIIECCNCCTIHHSNR